MTVKVRYIVQVFDDKGKLVYRETFNSKEGAEITSKGWSKFGFKVDVQEVRFGDR